MCLERTRKPAGALKGLCLSTAVSAAVVVAMMFPAAAAAQVVTAVMQSPLRVMDPITSSAAITNTHGYMIYDTLLAMDANYKVQPQMAEKWTVSPDGKTYTFTLRNGLKWHDGAPVKADDCVSSIKRWAEQDIMGQMVASLMTDMKVVDDKSFTMSFQDPTDLVLTALAKIGSRTAFIMPKRIADTPSAQPIKEFVGSGPFKLVVSEFKPGLKVVYEKNKDYVPRSEPPSWVAGGKVVNVDRVEWVAMPDDMTAINALTNGEIDYMELLPLDLLPMVEGKKDLKVGVLDQLGLWTYMRLNFTLPPFNNKQIRQAAMYAIGQDNILKALAGDSKYYKTCAAIFGCGTPYESSYGEAMIVKADPDKAKALLKEAKYDGTPVVILQPTDNKQVSSQPVVIADALRKAGFTVDLQSMDWQTLVTRRASMKPTAEGGWNIHATTGPLVGTGDPLRNQTVAASGKKAWFGWPDVPKIEELRMKFARSSNAAEKKALAEEIQKVVIDEVVVMPMGQFVLPTAYRTSLSGVLDSPVPVFWNVKKTGK
ncbi:ABC transporter substrate-binding protein [soil metagenome]